MQELFAVKYSFLIPLLPLIGAAISGFLGAKWLKQRSHWPIWIGVGASALISLTLLLGMLGIWGNMKPEHGEPTGRQAELSFTPTTQRASELGTNITWFDWITVGDFKSVAGAWIDPLTAVMLCIVTGIGFLITVFSAGYMRGEAGYFRFFAYLGLFIFMMTILVMGNNLVMLYLGWEGVGLCSYLLIGYYYEKPAAREAAKKAFLVNRVGDFGFGLGIMLSFLAFKTITYFGNGAGSEGLLEMATHGQNALQYTALRWI